MKLVVEGQLLSVFIPTRKNSDKPSKYPKFHYKGCQWKIVKAQRRFYSKIDASIPMFPFHLNAFSGRIRVEYICGTYHKAKAKLQDLLKVTQIGRFQSDGNGLIEWSEFWIEEKHKRKTPEYWKKRKRPRYRLKIHKFLPHNLPYAILLLIKYGLLHDFYHCKNGKGGIYPSKIYYEPEIQDQKFADLVRLSHSKTNHILVNTAQEYDQISASITRKFRSPRPSRYNWKGSKRTKDIDFRQLADQIKQVVDKGNINQLYELVHNSSELGMLNEALEYGHSSLKLHLLLIVNIIVQDYRKGKLDDYITNFNKLHGNSSTRRAI